ncbi:MAG: hypothetical protein ABI397_00380 [Candidatus Saccharimonas sp.]
MSSLGATPSAQQATAEMSRLINQRKYAKAVRFGAAIMESDISRKDAKFMFQLLLAYRLNGDGYMADAYWPQVKEYDGYTPLMEVDFHRDAVLALIRSRRLDEAGELLKQEHGIPKGDTPENSARRGAHAMALGLLIMAKGDYYRSLLALGVAGAMLSRGNEPQWILNNEFHSMVLESSVGNTIQARCLARNIRAKDPSRRKHQVARLVIISSYLGRWWLRRVASLLIRL